MTLYLVGENLDKTRSHYRAGTGKLIQLFRGIYIDAEDDADATVLRHAVRIAKYLYPRAYLSAQAPFCLVPRATASNFSRYFLDLCGPRSYWVHFQISILAP